MEAAINEAFERVKETRHSARMTKKCGRRRMETSLATTHQLNPNSDIWIAGTAMSYGMTLITRNVHFGRVAPYGLLYYFWR